LELLAKESFDLVLADEHMPMRGGLDLLAALRTDPRFPQLPLICCPCSAPSATQRTAHRPDAIGLKPIRAAALANLVDQVLTGKTPHAPVAIKSPPSPCPPSRQPRSSLVEDNPVNQRVAQRLLQKLAAEVTIANNGAEAWSASPPELRPGAHGLPDAGDGRLHRHAPHPRARSAAAPASAAHHRAHRQCHERGSRKLPGRRHGRAPRQAHRACKQMIDALSRFLKEEPCPPAIDLEALRELTGGDAEFERELADTFVASGDQCLAEIIAALKASDYDTVRKRAHA
jgi:CheY-like chemotaxis protein